MPPAVSTPDRHRMCPPTRRLEVSYGCLQISWTTSWVSTRTATRTRSRSCTSSAELSCLRWPSTRAATIGFAPPPRLARRGPRRGGAASRATGQPPRGAREAQNVESPGRSPAANRRKQSDLIDGSPLVACRVREMCFAPRGRSERRAHAAMGARVDQRPAGAGEPHCERAYHRHRRRPERPAPRSAPPAPSTRSRYVAGWRDDPTTKPAGWVTVRARRRELHVCQLITVFVVLMLLIVYAGFVLHDLLVVTALTALAITLRAVANQLVDDAAKWIRGGRSF